MRRAAITGFAVLALAAGGAFAAVAPAMEQETAGSKITIRAQAPSTFKGTVISAKDACLKGRTVKLFSASGDRISGAGTGKNGNWRVALEGKLEGSYYAKVTAKRVGSLLCKGARSPSVPAR